MEGKTKEAAPAASVGAQTLTFLFADLRGYSTFVEQHGDEAATALIADYRRLVRAEVARAKGGEIKTEGDSFYVVFATAKSALGCAIGILRAAEAHAGVNPARPIRVGVGLHVGEPVPHEGQYVGSAVNIAARLAQSAGAGELLVSEIVRALLRGPGVPPMTERDGLVLKGIADAPRVYAVDWQETPARGAPRPEAATPRAVGPEPAPTGRLGPSQVVGRERELAALETMLAAAVAGRGSAVLVSGEAGLGKSTILRAFAERVRASGAAYLVGECIEIEARRPFGPFVELLRAAFRERSASSLEETLRGGAAELFGLFPELARDTASEPPKSDDERDDERYRSHAAFGRIFADLARSGPLVLVIEDLHWADPGTLELFPYLARKVREWPVLLVGTYRSDELHRLHPLRKTLADIARGRLAEEVKLHKLTLEETGRVIRAIQNLPRDPSAEWREAIHRRCEGNPFFVEEVLKALAERGDLVLDASGAWVRAKRDVSEIAIPDSVRDALQERLRTLSDDARAALQQGAVIGQRFEFELLQRVSGAREDALLEHLTAAIDAQLLVEEAGPDGEERYAFRHALTRESVLAELLQRKRRLMHRTVAETIEAGAGDAADARAEELAYHFDQARDEAKAFRYHAIAGRAALRAGAYRAALQHLERAVELAPDAAPELGELQLELAEAAMLLHDLPRRGEALREARAAFEAAGNTRRLGETLRRLSLYLVFRGNPAEADPTLDRAIATLEPLGDTEELADAYATAGWREVTSREFDRARSFAERALAIARAVGSARAESWALALLGTVRVELEGEEGLPLLREALRVALDRGLPLQSVTAYVWLSQGLRLLGAPLDDVRAVEREMIAYAERRGVAPNQVLAIRVAQAFRDGDWDDALRWIGEYEDISAEDTTGVAVQRIYRGTILTARLGPEAGRSAVEWAARFYRSLRTAWGDRWAAAFDAVAAGAARDLPALVAHSGPMMADLESDTRINVVDLIAIVALAAAARGSDTVARDRWIDACARGSRRAAAPELRRRYAAAEAAAARGDVDAAIEGLREVAATARERLDWPPTTCELALRYADLLVARGVPGDREEAVRAIEAELAFWRRAGASWYLERLREELAPLGLDLPASAFAVP